MNSGPGSIRANQIVQAMRAAVNEVEADPDRAAHRSAAPPGPPEPRRSPPTPAGLTAARKILGITVRPCLTPPRLLDTTTGSSLHPAKREQRCDESKLPITAQGVITRISDLNVRESGQIVTSTAGTGATIKDQHRRLCRRRDDHHPQVHRRQPGLWWLAT